MTGLVSCNDLVLMGVSHQVATVKVRDLCAVPEAEVVTRLLDLAQVEGVSEAWLLSTCNRTEVLCVSSDADATAQHVRQLLFLDALAEQDGCVYRHDGMEAVFHLFRVISGLESQVLGETEIQRQVKRALDQARAAASLGPVLEALLQQSISVGKRVRTETSLGRGTLSVARAAVDLAHKIYGSFKRVAALVVGAGETGLLVARHLTDQGVERLAFANRTRERAVQAAEKFGGQVVDFEGLRDGIRAANLVVVCVQAPQPVVTLQELDLAGLRRKDRPVLMVDLSMPRAIDPALRGQRGLMVQDLDDLNQIVARHQQERQQQVDASRRILVEEVHKFLSLRTYDVLKPVVLGLVADFEQVRTQVLAELGAGADLEELAQKLTRRLLDTTFNRLKDGTRLTHSADAISNEYQKYLKHQ